MQRNLLASIEDLHNRVLQLESIWDVSYSVKDSKVPFMLTLSPNLEFSSVLLRHVASAQGKSLPGEIWVNHRSNIPMPIHSVEITKEIAVLKKSKDVPHTVVVCSAEINGKVRVILKFRKVENGSTTYNEREGVNALKIAFDGRLDGMFPNLLCMLEVQTKSPRDQSMSTWGCIGTQPLDELTEGEQHDTSVLQRCSDLLRRLHKSGYVHGNPCLHNFMKHPHNRGQVVMIDQDEVRDLPVVTDTDFLTISNYMQITDYLHLVFHGNPYCDAFMRVPHEIHESLFRKIFESQPKNAITLCPFPYYFHGHSSFEDIKRDLMSVPGKPGDVPYWHYLKTMDAARIDQCFSKLLADKGTMQKMNDTITKTFANNYGMAARAVS